MSTLLRLLAPALCGLAACAATAAPADLFRQWTTDTWVERRVSLAELGFEKPIVLQGDDNESRRELFLPVPAALPIRDATLQLDADYLRGDGGRSTFVVSLDGYPVSARRFTDERGTASLTQGVDGTPRESGFVRLGLGWNSTISDVICADQRAPGNVLRLQPTTHLRYRIDRNQLGNLSTAWSTLPPRPVLLVSGRQLAPAAYDTAWRIGMALERAGRRLQVRALPAVGDTVQLAGTELPAELRGVPAFAALAGGGSHRIASAAEVGALLVLGQRGPLRADLAIADGQLARAVGAALDALGAQLGADAEAFTAWRRGAFSLATGAPPAGEVALRQLGGAPVISVAAEGGDKAALLFDSLWKPVAGGSAIVLKNIARPRPDDRVLLSQLGGAPGSLDVGNRSDWTATFGIEDVAHDGRAPVALVLDLASSPDSVGQPAVGSIFLNDYLLGAELLRADGKPYRMRVPVPQHLLAPRNVVRITFLRQLTKPRCHDQQTSYPVSVLPSSHVELGAVPVGASFAGMGRRFADGGELLVPTAWLEDAATTLPRTIRLADAAGLSLAGTRMVVVPRDGDAPRPGGNFLALDLPVGDAGARVDPARGRLLVGTQDKPLLEAERLSRGGVLQLAEAGGHRGLVWRPTGTEGSVPLRPVRLGSGDVALLDADGVVLEVNSRDPRGAGLADEANPQNVWQRHRRWWIALAIVLVVLLLAARVLQVRRRRAAARQLPQ